MIGVLLLVMMMVLQWRRVLAGLLGLARVRTRRGAGAVVSSGELVGQAVEFDEAGEEGNESESSEVTIPVEDEALQQALNSLVKVGVDALTEKELLIIKESKKVYILNKLADDGEPGPEDPTDT